MTAVTFPQSGSIQHGSKHEDRTQYEIPHLPHIIPLINAHLDPPVRVNENDRAYPSAAVDSPCSTSPTRSETAHAPVGSQEALARRPHRQLLRSNTDYGSRRHSPSARHNIAEENWELRHGWEDQYNSSEYLGLLSSVCIESLTYKISKIKHRRLTICSGILHVLHGHAP